MSNKSAPLRKAKEHVLRCVLEPVGFLKGKLLFARKAGEQLHAVQYKPSKWGGYYFVNIAFHYDFLPPFGTVAHEFKSPPYQDYRLVDFMLYSRLEHWMPTGYPWRWNYGEEHEGLEQQVERNARDAMSVLDALSERWRDPSVFLELLSPGRLAEDKREELERIKMSDEEIEQRPPLWIEKTLGVGWQPTDYFGMGYYLALIALRVGKKKPAREYVAIAERNVDDLSKKALMALKGRLR